jgi:hypothetical protein
MTHVSLDDNPKYEALSYTWGSPINKASIRVGSAWLSVTQNLFSALHALSPHGTYRIIWIDAMCINQNDPTERDHQVAFMMSIYTRANRVIVWLGSAADNSEAVMDYIGTIIPEPDLTEHKSWVYSDTWNWDECILVAGLAMPLVARLGEKGRLEIIGECYVHGYMDGEAAVELGYSEEELCFF